MDMQGIAPYTLIVWSERNLFQLVWDGENKQTIILKNDQPYIWSSATLYDETATLYRDKLFKQWAGLNLPVSALSLLNFFKSYTDAENGFIINRSGKIKTLSYTFIELKLNISAAMQYYDLPAGTNRLKKIKLNTAVAVNSSPKNDQLKIAALFS